MPLPELQNLPCTLLQSLASLHWCEQDSLRPLWLIASSIRTSSANGFFIQSDPFRCLLLFPHCARRPSSPSCPCPPASDPASLALAAPLIWLCTLEPFTDCCPSAICLTYVLNWSWLPVASSGDEALGAGQAHPCCAKTADASFRIWGTGECSATPLQEPLRPHAVRAGKELGWEDRLAIVWSSLRDLYFRILQDQSRQAQIGTLERALPPLA